MASIKAQLELDVTDEQFEQAVENALKNNPDWIPLPEAPKGE